MEAKLTSWLYTSNTHHLLGDNMAHGEHRRCSKTLTRHDVSAMTHTSVTSRQTCATGSMEAKVTSWLYTGTTHHLLGYNMAHGEDRRLLKHTDTP